MLTPLILTGIVGRPASSLYGTTISLFLCDFSGIGGFLTLDSHEAGFRQVKIPGGVCGRGRFWRRAALKKAVAFAKRLCYNKVDYGRLAPRKRKGDARQ